MASKEYHNNHTKQRRAVRREYIASKKMEQGCCKCGYNAHPAALHFDHIDRSTKSGGLAQAASEGWSFERIDEEIAKCQVLCANCHSIHTYELKHFHTIARMGEVGTPGSSDTN